VVLQHGLAEHAGRYVTDHGGIVGRLTGMGIAVYAMDLLGHGVSPGRRRVVDVRSAVRAHGAVRREAGRLGVAVVAVGHSLGGLITAGSVAADPGGLAGAVLLSPALVRSLPAAARLGALALGRVAPALPARPITDGPDALSRRTDVLERAAADPLMSGGAVPLRTGSTILQVSQDVWRAAPRWTTPTLIAHGTADRVTGYAHSARLAALIGGAATFVRVEGGHHELLHDTDGEHTLATVLAWVDARLEG